MSWLEEDAIMKNAEEYRKIILSEMNKEREIEMGPIKMNCRINHVDGLPTTAIVENSIELKALKVSYNGFTGELMNLDRRSSVAPVAIYDLTIYDKGKNVTHSFTGVKLSDMKFLGGVVTFGE